jgi:hypothetical protein
MAADKELASSNPGMTAGQFVAVRATRARLSASNTHERPSWAGCGNAGRVACELCGTNSEPGSNAKFV